MAGKHEWPDDETLLALIAERGGKHQAAEALGVAASSLTSHLKRQGLWEKATATVTPLRAPKLGEQVSHEEMLRARVNELEAEARKARDGEVAEERMLRRFEQVIPAIQPKYRPLKRSPGKQGEHEMVLLFSDTHAGEVVDSDETLGMNVYDWRTMLDRMARLQRAVLSYVEHRPYPVAKLHVWMLGDMLSGSIHDELAQTNEFADAQAVVQFATDTAKWIEEFVPHFPAVRVAGVPGNHPRRQKKPQAKRAFNNDDWVAYQMMRLYHRNNPAIEWNFPEASYAVETVADRWRCLLMHGDGIRSSMPGVPWGGVVRRVTTLQQQFAKAKQPIDYIALGHFHTANALEGVGTKTFLNGSVKGLDEYSLKQFGSGRPPMQLLLTVHPERGVTDVSYLDLEPVAPAMAA